MQVKEEGMEYQIICSEHQQICQFLSLSKEVGKNRLLCHDCLHYDKENGKWRFDLNELIPLSVAISSPESIIDKILSYESRKYLKSVFSFCQSDLQMQFTKEIEKIELSLMQIINKIKQFINSKLQEFINLQSELIKEREHFLTKIKYKDFQILIQQLQQINQQEKQEKDELFEKSRIQLSQIIDSMIQEEGSLIQQSFSETFQNTNTYQINKLLGQLNLSDFNQEIEKPIIDFDKFLASLSIISRESNILNKKFKKFLLKYIEKQGEIAHLYLLFQGQRNNLSYESLCKKINGKKNLLMIFKAKQSQIFGGYTPCNWDLKLNNYAKDNDSTSFLFDQQSAQIYPLKQQQNKYAIFCSPEVIQFGQSDMCISSEFKVVQQNRIKSESTYTEFQSAKYTELKIEDCEIFEIIFK